MDLKRLNVKGLSGACIDTQSVDIDWTEAFGEDGGWEFMESAECPDCGRVCVGAHEAHCEHCASYFETYNEGPMMSYHYPIPSGSYTEGNALALHGLPLCLVQFEDGECSLALTGGGMDLSWEICEAFILLGYNPPVQFCRLPRMAGKRPTTKNLKIIAACEDTMRSEKKNAEWCLSDLSDLRKSLK